jgi:hypothetical protein
VQHATVELVALLVKRRQRIAMDRDQVVARDEQVHLAQRLRVLSAMAPRAVEDQEYVVAVVVELRALTKVLGVFERERMKPEQFAQLREILMTRGREVQPEEVITLKVVADPRLVDACATRHHELELLAGGVYRCCLRLAYGHGSSPWSLRARHSPPGRACSK